MGSGGSAQKSTKAKALQQIRASSEPPGGLRSCLKQQPQGGSPPREATRISEASMAFDRRIPSKESSSASSKYLAVSKTPSICSSASSKYLAASCIGSEDSVYASLSETSISEVLPKHQARHMLPTMEHSTRKQQIASEQQAICQGPSNQRQRSKESTGDRTHSHSTSKRPSNQRQRSKESTGDRTHSHSTSKRSASLPRRRPPIAKQPSAPEEESGRIDYEYGASLSEHCCGAPIKNMRRNASESGIRSSRWPRSLPQITRKRPLAEDEETEVHHHQQRHRDPKKFQAIASGTQPDQVAHNDALRGFLIGEAVTVAGGPDASGPWRDMGNGVVIGPATKTGFLLVEFEKTRDTFTIKARNLQRVVTGNAQTTAKVHALSFQSVAAFEAILDERDKKIACMIAQSLKKP